MSEQLSEGELWNEVKRLLGELWEKRTLSPEQERELGAQRALQRELEEIGKFVRDTEQQVNNVLNESGSERRSEHEQESSTGSPGEQAHESD